MFRKWFCILLSCLLLAGCLPETEEKETTIKIGVSVYDSYDTFISELMTEFSGDLAGNDNVTLMTYNASASQTTQNKQVETMIENGCNVICVNLVDRTSPGKIIDLAKKNKIPVIFFNRELVEEDLFQSEDFYYIGADAAESGRIEGEIAAEACRAPEADRNEDGVIQYIVLEGEAGHQDAIVRTEKSVDTLIEEGISVDKIASAIANWSRSQAQTRMAAFIEQYGDSIELVLGNNDDMALGAIDAYKASGTPREEWPVIVGIDGTDTGLQAVVNGEMVGTVYNDKEGQAKAMAELALSLAAGSHTTSYKMENGKYIRLPYQKITIDNVKDYID